MSAPIASAFESTRDLSGKPFRSGCYAPYTSLYFDTVGNVRVCCHNWSYTVGNICSDTISAIWSGPGIQAIRTAVKNYDFTQGCQFCAWQLDAGYSVNIPISKWDKFTVTAEDPKWPQIMEFSISNTCNLECIMCDGELSSAIRAHREKLPPLPAAYSDSFFLELRTYLPHLVKAKFLGGEPFLQAECFRIWDMLIEDGIRIPIGITTNGTQYNARVERVLAYLPAGIVISMDGFTKEMYEGIRVHAKHDSVLANVMLFREYTRSRKTPFSFAYCLMRNNCYDLADFCAFAESIDADVWINVVRRPPALSLYTLPSRQLLALVNSMEDKGHSLIPRMGRNYPVWQNEIKRLRDRAFGMEIPGLTHIQGVSHR